MAAPEFKKWGGKKGATIDYGGGKHVRVAHIASAKREPIFLNCWGPIFGGVQGPALGPLAGCRGRAPAGGPGGGAPGRFWIYAFQSPKIAVFESHISHFLKG